VRPVRPCLRYKYAGLAGSKCAEGPRQRPAHLLRQPLPASEFTHPVPVPFVAPICLLFSRPAHAPTPLPRRSFIPRLFFSSRHLSLLPLRRPCQLATALPPPLQKNAPTMAVAGGFFILFLTSQKYLNTAKCSSFLFWHKLMAKYSQLPCMLWYEPFSFKFIYSCYFYIVFIHVHNFHAHVYIYSVCGEFLHLIQGFGLDSKFYFILA
jgi:hypothetical protein